MRVPLEVSGGIAGLRLSGEVDTDALPPDERARVEAALDPGRLAQAAATTREGPPAPDERAWRVTLGGETFEVAESRLEPDQLGALDALTTALVRQARDRGGG
ncbi:MAG TPA: protealysin inhibitor emfourin [Acidimicrobiales bacterium]